MSQSELDRLVIDHQKLAYHIALKVWKRGGRSADLEEFRSEALLALVDAARRFDVSKGFAFSSYAYPCIEGQLLRYLQVDSELSVNHREKIAAGEAVPVTKVGLTITGSDGEEMERPIADRSPSAEAALIAEDETGIPGIGMRPLLRWLKMRRCTLSANQRRIVRHWIINRRSIVETAGLIGISRAAVYAALPLIRAKMSRISISPVRTGRPRVIDRVTRSCRNCGIDFVIPDSKWRPGRACGKRCAIALMHKAHRKLPGKDALRRLYFDDKRSTVWIARSFGVTDPGTVRKALLAHGFTLRGRGDSATQLCIEPGCRRPALKVPHKLTKNGYGTRCAWHRKVHYAKLGRDLKRRKGSIPEVRWRTVA